MFVGRAKSNMHETFVRTITNKTRQQCNTSKYVYVCNFIFVHSKFIPPILGEKYIVVQQDRIKHFFCILGDFTTFSSNNLDVIKLNISLKITVYGIGKQRIVLFLEFFFVLAKNHIISNSFLSSTIRAQSVFCKSSRKQSLQASMEARLI